MTFEIDYANLEKALVHDIHGAKAIEMFGKDTPETRRIAKIINLGELYGGNMRPFGNHKPEFQLQPSQESDLLQKARAYLEVNERWGMLRQEWLEAKHAFKKECNRVDFPLGPGTHPNYVTHAAERIVAKGIFFHREAEHCGF